MVDLQGKERILKSSFEPKAKIIRIFLDEKSDLKP